MSRTFGFWTSLLEARDAGRLLALGVEGFADANGQWSEAPKGLGFWG
jgi:hypothetical protein